MDGHDAETGEIVEWQAPRQQQAILPMASPSCAQVWTALGIAQGAFEPPKRTKEATVEGQTRAGGSYKYKYQYAPLEEIERVIKKPLSENGLFRQQYLVSRNGQWFIRTMIGHTSGEWIACDYPIFVSKEGAQGFASGVTYARRYGLSLALGLAPEDDDDAQIADSAPAAAPAGDVPAGGPRTRAQAEAAQRASQRPTAAPQHPRYQEALAALRGVQASIDAAQDIEELADMSVSAEWETLCELLREASPTTADAAIDRLHERMDARQNVLRGMNAVRGAL